jgi:hypothetical protein
MQRISCPAERPSSIYPVASSNFAEASLVKDFQNIMCHKFLVKLKFRTASVLSFHPLADFETAACLTD